ncbi:MAG: sensor domain-containing diguanylate cyclase, partial [Myxococcota bacterium]|nr:sensor domain-containing diguanylate cyclase [Myxococcota bacterium]
IERARARTGIALGFGGVLTLLIALSALLNVRRDLHAMDAAARALAKGEQRFRMLAESASDLIRVHDRGGALTYVSPSAHRLLGYTPEEMLEMEPDALLPGEERARMREAVDRVLTRDEPSPPLVHRLLHEDGSVRWFETRIEPISDEDGALRRYHSASRDVTARVENDHAIREQQAELAREAEQLREISHRDELTGLLNRRGLLELGARVLPAARDAGRTAVAYFADLDGLKEINDRLGHDEGDRAIVDAAEILRDAARGADLLARLGGDELVVLSVVRDASAASAYHDRIEERVARHNAGAQRPYRLSMSVGLATAAPDGEVRSLEDLIADADAAMYERKKSRASITQTGEPIVRNGRG